MNKRQNSVQNIKKIKGNSHFVKLVLSKLQKYHFNFYKFGIIGKLVKFSVRECKNRQDVPFVVFGHIFKW